MLVVVVGSIYEESTRITLCTKVVCFYLVVMLWCGPY